jgi:hypothetical protein
VHLPTIIQDLVQWAAPLYEGWGYIPWTWSVWEGLSCCCSFSPLGKGRAECRRLSPFLLHHNLWTKGERMQEDEVMHSGTYYPGIVLGRWSFWSAGLLANLCGSTTSWKNMLQTGDRLWEYSWYIILLSSCW